MVTFQIEIVMDIQAIYKQNISFNTFVSLLFGLEEYTQNQSPTIPQNIRQALNHLAFEMGNDFPRTFYNFISLCHEPLVTWYPLLPIPDGFNPQFPLLDQGHLSDEAQEFCFYLTEQIQISPINIPNMSATMLDNLEMIQFRQELKNNPNPESAQDIYVRVRSFLIENSWVSIDNLRRQFDIFSLLVRFYEPIDEYYELIECEQCGLLEKINGKWVGLKPTYCSDHGNSSPYIHPIKNTGNLFRLKRGIHLRTFIPGKIELSLFEFAEQIQEEHPNHLISVERYPRLDTYDLRLTFSDDEVWAIDAKDQSNPRRLGKQIYLPYGEGDLSYHRAFYVIPDRRMDEWGYRDTLNQVIGFPPPNLHILSLSEFCESLAEKVKKISKPSRRKKH